MLGSCGLKLALNSMTVQWDLAWLENTDIIGSVWWGDGCYKHILASFFFLTKTSKKPEDCESFFSPHFCLLLLLHLAITPQLGCNGLFCSVVSLWNKYTWYSEVAKEKLHHPCLDLAFPMLITAQQGHICITLQTAGLLGFQTLKVSSSSADRS